MHPALAQGLIDGDEWVKKIFTEDFHTAKQWREYILEKFGGGPSVLTILNKPNGWSRSDFQALYIACWIFFPVEKGSYMITLTKQQRANVKSGYETLDKRWTSHLHEHGRSAAKGWSFLAGYHELLVQMEGGGKHTKEAEPHLFLKCEGHTAFTLAHLKSYYEKKKTGKGATANPWLQEMARRKKELGLDVGITERAAENYSNAYKTLLKQMGLKGKTVTVHEAAASMFVKCQQAMREQQSIQPSLTSLMGTAGLQSAVSERGVGGLNNVDVATLIEKVLVPFANSLNSTKSSPATKEFASLLLEAKDDLKVVAAQLRADAANTGQERTLRYFQEVVLSPLAIDAGLKAGYAELSGWSVS
jgi:hypothetical protein